MDQYKQKYLIKRAAKGDVAAYETLIIFYEKTIYNICLRILKDDHMAYDATQEVCLKVWCQIQSFKGNAKFSTWLYRLTVNQCLDIIRKNKKLIIPITLSEKEKGEEKDYEDKRLQNQSVWEDVSEKIVQKEREKIVMQAIGELKIDYQVMIVLRDIEEQSYEDIAEILSLSLGTVKSRIYRARLALKKILEQDKEPYRSFFRHKLI